MMLAVLLVVASNIINGAYALDDVDDLLEKPDLNKLKLEISKEEMKRARAAQASEANARQKSASKGNNPKAGKGMHRGR